MMNKVKETFRWSEKSHEKLSNRAKYLNITNSECMRQILEQGLKGNAVNEISTDCMAYTLCNLIMDDVISREELKEIVNKLWEK